MSRSSAAAEQKRGNLAPCQGTLAYSQGTLGQRAFQPPPGRRVVRWIRPHNERVENNRKKLLPLGTFEGSSVDTLFIDP
eukprot:1194844-Prorocentrum_minimum.AAC.2